MKPMLAALILCLLSPAALAESQVGFLAGINRSSTPNSTARTGILVGGFYQLRFAEEFYLEPQLRFAKRRTFARATTFDGLLPGDSLRRLAYFEIPVYVKYKPSFGTKVKPFFYAGPNFSFRNNAEVDFRSDDGSFSADGYAITNASSFVLAVDLGAGAEIAIHDRWRLSASVAFSQGITDSTNNTPDSITRSHAFQAYLALSNVL